MSFIIVGVDGSASSEAALHAAVDQAQLLGCEVRVFNIVVLPAMSGYEFGPIDLSAMKTAAEATVERAVDALNAEYGGTVPVPISTHVRTGHIGIELLRASQEDEGASMIVAGSRGYGGFRSLMLGSVTTYLAHHLECPLLIIPAVAETDAAS